MLTYIGINVNENKAESSVQFNTLSLTENHKLIIIVLYW